MNIAADVAFDRFIESIYLALEAVRREQKSETTGEYELWAYHEAGGMNAANWNAQSLLFRGANADCRAAQLRTLAPLVRMI